ncbi:MAG TPA: 2-oxoglutarate dehydrogenase E1 component [Stenomitos sp.]
MNVDSTLMAGGNAAFLEALYEDFLADPQSVAPEWRAYFEGLKGAAPGPEVAHTPVQRAFAELVQSGRHLAVAPTTMECAPVQHGVGALISAYRAMGHLQAKFNPLSLRPQEPVPELDLSYHGLNTADLDYPVSYEGFHGPLRQVFEDLRATYCGPIGFEFSYLPRVEREWLQQRIESTRGHAAFDRATKLRILAKVNAAEAMEKYLHQRYVGQKRFSLEGGDSLIPLMDQAILSAGRLGVKEIVVGMAHRGRLNMLVNIFGKKTSQLFAEFEGKKELAPNISGDVKYHLGFSADMETEGGPVHLALGFNPSHLEIINPVVEGSVRARQDRRSDLDRSQVLPVLVHGDSAVSGQGVVAETLNLSQLRGFTTGGTFHVVVNNQVGFSISDPQDVRSTRYSTDIAKFIDAPVFHVNGDDPEAVVYAALLALDYRMTFHKDVFIDLVCWRRHGHNESDEPRATQPDMYVQIDKHPGVPAVYARKLEAEGILQPGELKQLTERYRDALDQGLSVADAVESDYISIKGNTWAPYLNQSWRAAGDTRVPLETLKALGRRLTTLPEGFKLHPRIDRILKGRVEMTEGKLPVDWGFAENLAYATLVTQDQTPVRFTGQDAGRGTFFHRHAALHDQRPTGIPEGQVYVPLQHVAPDQAWFNVIDSTLSEEGVLGFEYGYSSTEPNVLDIWEAQYGDFANVAQSVIDQFISAGEAKWQRLSGLVMMLPHGYEGQGPEHSSARLERYMQLCAEDNMQVCVPSTPAQMYHMLRRQIVRPFRKPLIIMSPKSLLRHKASVSSLEELATGTFQPVIGETRPATGIERVVVCSGKLYYDFVEARETRGLQNVALVRLEQLYPFPGTELSLELSKYPGAQVVWAQEEPENQGAWFFLRDNLEACLASGQALDRACRPASASPAVGYAAKHNEQQQAIIDRAFGLTAVAERSREGASV